MAFRALEPVLFGLEGGFTGSTHLVPKPLPFRFAPDHVASPDLRLGLKLIPGACGQSRVVSSPSSGYPHVRSKQAGQCLPGCAQEQIQATVQREVRQIFRNLGWDERARTLR